MAFGETTTTGVDWDKFPVKRRLRFQSGDTSEHEHGIYETVITEEGVETRKLREPLKITPLCQFSRVGGFDKTNRGRTAKETARFRSTSCPTGRGAKSDNLFHVSSIRRVGEGYEAKRYPFGEYSKAAAERGEQPSLDAFKAGAKRVEALYGMVETNDGWEPVELVFSGAIYGKWIEASKPVDLYGATGSEVSIGGREWKFHSNMADYWVPPISVRKRAEGEIPEDDFAEFARIAQEVTAFFAAERKYQDSYLKSPETDASGDEKDPSSDVWERAERQAQFAQDEAPATRKAGSPKSTAAVLADGSDDEDDDIPF